MVRLRPLERDGDEHLGNEGAARLMKKWTGHTRVGIPYYLVLDEKGAQLANCEKVEYGSASPRVGVFAQDGEHLIEVLKKTGRHFTDSDRGRLQKWIDSQ